ncbi:MULTISPECIES: tetratricopeptide repeat protein [Paraburkholderia]|uniref:tetratricopeptide repeat protein n=1 Tax=Paraburkholderia TaxID=1822464 RepID=UPI00225988F0|nr:MULTISPECIES: tetratricopeptide repeat protein [Paraburkholderia]MCX4165309.1 tetratricopeptide repeat protein [Paraburkholderia megapolitana]MDN7160801.1 tetratricopeptide repeat protein [Paraburkholderia sp. CHISQ3]MDQ6497848.1 tetratricopeptide repeat protein [Paraburkholderia megapolitana]
MSNWPAAAANPDARATEEGIAALLAQAKTHHLSGDLTTARRLYEAVLTERPAHADASFRLGILDLQCGDAGRALISVERALACEPHQTRYRFGRAQVLVALQRFDDAIDVCRDLLIGQPASVDILFVLAHTLQAKGDMRAAVDTWLRVLDLDPACIEALNQLGNAYRHLGDLSAAEQSYRRALAVQPANADALTNLGSVLRVSGRLDEATMWLRKAVQSDPRNAAAHVNLGVALCERREYAQALALLERAVELDPTSAEAAYNLGNAAHATGRPRDAIVQYRRAIELKSDHADAHNNLGNAHRSLGEFAAAADAFAGALRLRPDSIAACNNLGNLYRTLGRTDDAKTYLRRALAIDPTHSVSHNNLGNVLKDGGALDDAIASYRRALDCDADNVIAHSNLLYALTFRCDDAQTVRDESRRWSARHEDPLRTTLKPHGNDRAPNRRLRIGYVSADFRDHCQALFTIPLLAHHDHDAFEIVCYSSVERPDAVTARIAAYADVWRDVRTLDDEQLAQTIRADGIDILIDLTMHMADGRPLLFVRKPAPVQVAWLAYPGTTGIDAIDYRLTDAHLDPSWHDSHYSEQSVRALESFWCYDPLTDTPAVNALPASKRVTNGAVTLGCLNNPCKLTDRTLAMWAGVMQALPYARLVLMSAAGEGRERLVERADAQGIDTARVSFVPFRPRAAYLATYHDIDLGLDTFPYNGHTTSLDSLWMGVPVVTRVGQTAVGRGGLSQLANLGLSELAAYTDEEFVRIAVELARDLPRLSALRSGLRTRLEASPLMDGSRFAYQVERAYRQMWRTWAVH